MGIYIGIQIFVIGLFFLLGWAVRYKKQYGILSGFNGRSEEEQKQLIENGFPQKTGSLLIWTALGMLILLPLVFTSFPYAIEVQYGFMIIFILSGFIYLTKYELPHKRKRSYWISSVIGVAVVGLICVIMFLGYQKSDLVIKEATFAITGMYGDEWNISEIEEVELMVEMPEVTIKSNGFAMGTIAKGKFQVKNYGSSLLFIRKQPPYLYIKVKNQSIFINGASPEETQNWYLLLSSKRP
ncbi:DUF3784 domain-containing protein [Niallia endozanthoxylica]|uniref:DUF3784 domain-containing protein n=2 Tax=Niallia endozanthoxylica TaxID=2036016 RepID=A0A5J5HNN2_9BACI|nr:DUF3784 domain-containing protein [Niallia endozanthoxylica]